MSQFIRAYAENLTKFLKIKIFEIQSIFSFWPLRSGKIYIEGENDIQNPKEKLSTNDNHYHLQVRLRIIRI